LNTLKIFYKKDPVPIRNRIYVLCGINIGQVNQIGQNKGEHADDPGENCLSGEKHQQQAKRGDTQRAVNCVLSGNHNGEFTGGLQIQTNRFGKPLPIGICDPDREIDNGNCHKNLPQSENAAADHADHFFDFIEDRGNLTPNHLPFLDNCIHDPPPGETEAIIAQFTGLRKNLKKPLTVRFIVLFFTYTVNRKDLD